MTGTRTKSTLRLKATAQPLIPRVTTGTIAMAMTSGHHGIEWALTTTTRRWPFPSATMTRGGDTADGTITIPSGAARTIPPSMPGGITGIRLPFITTPIGVIRGMRIAEGDSGQRGRLDRRAVGEMCEEVVDPRAFTAGVQLAAGICRRDTGHHRARGMLLLPQAPRESLQEEEVVVMARALALAGRAPQFAVDQRVEEVGGDHKPHHHGRTHRHGLQVETEVVKDDHIRLRLLLLHRHRAHLPVAEVGGRREAAVVVAAAGRGVGAVDKAVC